MSVQGTAGRQCGRVRSAGKRPTAGLPEERWSWPSRPAPLSFTGAALQRRLRENAIGQCGWGFRAQTPASRGRRLDPTWTRGEDGRCRSPRGGAGGVTGGSGIYHPTPNTLGLIPGGGWGGAPPMTPDQAAIARCAGRLSFSSAQCGHVRQAIRQLQSSSNPMCASLGRGAGERFWTGNIRYHPSVIVNGDSTFGYMFPGRSGTWLTPLAFRPRELANTVSHEESHHRGYGHPDADHIGYACAGPV
jgi:hypothetical protein